MLTMEVWLKVEECIAIYRQWLSFLNASYRKEGAPKFGSASFTIENPGSVAYANARALGW